MVSNDVSFLITNRLLFVFTKEEVPKIAGTGCFTKINKKRESLARLLSFLFEIFFCLTVVLCSLCIYNLEFCFKSMARVDYSHPWSSDRYKSKIP